MTPTIVLITGHPATGKTTLAHNLTQELRLPLIWKDQIKETLLDVLGSSTNEWSRKLGAVAWMLLYQQIENLIKTDISHIVESNFDPIYANGHWQSLSCKYKFQLIQVRCETEPEALLKRYSQRIHQGDRHLGHVDASNDNVFLESIKQHMDWVDVESYRLSLDTTDIEKVNYLKITEQIRTLISNNGIGILRAKQE